MNILGRALELEQAVLAASRRLALQGARIRVAHTAYRTGRLFRSLGLTSSERIGPAAFRSRLESQLFYAGFREASRRVPPERQRPVARGVLESVPEMERQAQEAVTEFTQGLMS
jgi:hypothetical protein